MDVEYHFDLLAHRITHRRKLLDGSNQRAAGIEGSILLGQTPAREAPPLLPALQARLDEGGGVQAGFLVVRVAELAQFPDMRMTIEAMVSDGDTVAVRVLSEGTNLGSLNGVVPPTGRRFSARQSHWYRVAGGKLAEHWATREDLPTMLRLGVIQPPPGGPPPSV